MSEHLDPRPPGIGTTTLTIAIVGPTHPYQGGVASHTTTGHLTASRR